MAVSVDTLLRNGILIDGTGAPGRPCEIGIRADRVAFVGNAAGMTAGRVIDAGGRVVAPGFIDIHTHCSVHPTANYLQQGVTLVVTGNCGFSDADLQPMIDRCEAGQAGPNIATLIGHTVPRAKRTDPRPDRTDTATFEDPARRPVGIGQVLVNGVRVVDHGKYTGACPGRFIARPS